MHNPFHGDQAGRDTLSINMSNITPDEALKKLQRYCAYQDRCHQEVRSKLLDLGIRGYDVENIMAELITDNFLNEERFAKSYVRGKFRVKKWGRIRIKQELNKRKISAYCQKKGLAEIEEEDYQNTLYQLIEKKNELLKEDNIYHRKQRIAAFVIRKGYESHLAWAAINELIEVK